MQFTINVQDNFVPDFLAMINRYQDKVQVEKNEHSDAVSNHQESIKKLLANRPANLFAGINDPLLWQQQQREEW